MSHLYVQPDELATMLSRPDVRVVDTRASLADGVRGHQLWIEGHVPGAVHADWLEDWGRTVDGVDGMLPGPDEFARDMSRLGIDNDTHVVAYDDNALFTASRLAWALLEYGHRSVTVLDGGFPAWKAAALPVSTDETDGNPTPREYRPGAPQGTCHDMSRVRTLLDRRDVRIVDCRMDETFLASAGRVPGATRLPSPTLVDQRNRFKKGDELARLAAGAGISTDGPTVLYCGGGVSAAAVFVALRDAGYSNLALYDGSWSEWSRYPDNPVQAHE